MKISTSFVPLLATSAPADLGPGPRAGVLALPELHSAVDAALETKPLRGLPARVLRALVLLWHDHHDEAHAIVQDMSGVDAAYVHGILHRREPDYGNAKYWVRRVGTHPCHEALSKEAAELLKEQGFEDLRSKLLPGGRWDAFAFVDACEAAGKGNDSTRTARFLREIQRAEFQCLLVSIVLTDTYTTV
ncbi:MAG: hypothetical protein QOF48_3240 [Verrucomicrobiota bacterium]|jgi:hypothetical protein